MPTVRTAPSRGHSWTISRSAAGRNAPATRAAAASLEVASAAIRRPPGRSSGISAAIQRSPSAGGSPVTFSTTSADSVPRPNGSSAAASATSSGWDLSWRGGTCAAPGAGARSRPAAASAPPRERRAQPGGTEDDHRRARRRPATPGALVGGRSGDGSSETTPPASAGCREDRRATDRASAGGSYHGPETNHEPDHELIVQLDRDAPAEEIGGKARSLVKLAAAGLPVPPAMALTSELFSVCARADHRCRQRWRLRARWRRSNRRRARCKKRPGRRGSPRGSRGALAALDGRAEARFGVRSSAAMEDRPDALGAGLFLSRLDLRAADVERALREVLASALAPGVVAYLARRSLAIGRPRLRRADSAVRRRRRGRLCRARFVARGPGHRDAPRGRDARPRPDPGRAHAIDRHPRPGRGRMGGERLRGDLLQMRPYRRPARARLATVSQSGSKSGCRPDRAGTPPTILSPCRPRRPGWWRWSIGGATRGCGNRRCADTFSIPTRRAPPGPPGAAPPR